MPHCLFEQLPVKMQLQRIPNVNLTNVNTRLIWSKCANQSKQNPIFNAYANLKFFKAYLVFNKKSDVLKFVYSILTNFKIYWF